MGEIPLLVPDLPSADALLPWLRRLDGTRQYTNFGPLVQALEQALAADWPVPAVDASQPLQVVTAASGAAALQAAVTALDLPAGAAVLLPAYTFPATAAAVMAAGLKPVLADVDADRWQLSPATARAALQRLDLRLIVPVASFGLPLDVVGWDRLVQDSGVPVVMDAAAAFGNQAVGRHAHAVFSLHATKPFGIGEGGLFASRDAALAARVRSLTNFGFRDGRVQWPAGNAKLSEYAAAVGLCQWARFGALRERRRAAWAGYRRLLADLPGVRLQAGWDGPALPANVVLRLPTAAAGVAALLQRHGVQTRRWYWPTLPGHPAFAGCPVFAPEDSAPLARTAALAEHALGLPWHGFLSEADQRRIHAALAQALAKEPAHV